MEVAPPYRTFWRRFWAGSVDGFVLGEIGALDYYLWPHSTSSLVSACRLVMLWVAGPAYSIYLHGRFGQTIGKRLLRIRVVDVSERPLTVRQAFLREALNLPLAVWSLLAALFALRHGGDPDDMHLGPPIGVYWGLLGLELVSTLGSFKRRALHDLIAGSVVVRVPALQADVGEYPDEDFRNDNIGTERSLTTSGKQFACPVCGANISFGASHCRRCDQAFDYRDGRPTPTSFRS
jgi:uncharacterized RDD family membrane protein YckC/predicted RNA-binding Zn-ribbon protein involved in translation (DUF1610 family)